MKLLIVAQNLQIGGIQRALINMLDVLSSDKNFEIDLFVFGEGPLLKEIPKNVRIIKGKRLLRLAATPFSIVKKNSSYFDVLLRIILMLIARILGSEKFYSNLFYLEKKLGKYDVAISYFNDVPNNYFNRGTNQYVDEFVNAKKKIAWVHTDPIGSKFNREECKKKYKNFDFIVGVSKAVSNKLIHFLPEYKEKVTTVYNFFPIDKIRFLGTKNIIQTPSNLITLVTVSRIDNNTKRLNLIPKIVKRILENNINNFKWIVVGDGPDLDLLKKRVDELEINDYLLFLGNKINPYPYINASSLFILVSKYEGYPMVIGESLILGTPVLTTNFAAASEQINNGKNGVIVKMDEESIITELIHLLTNRDQIKKMKKFIKDNPYTNKVAKEQLRYILETKYAEE